MIKPWTAVILLCAGWVNLLAALAWNYPFVDLIGWICPATAIWFIVEAISAALRVAAWLNIISRLRP